MDSLRYVVIQLLLIFLIFILYVVQVYKTNWLFFESFLNQKIKNFTILGERCSGTNYLQHAMEKNFDVPITWKYGWKHWFGDHRPYDDSDANETLFLVLYRNPVDWLNSLFRDQHHLEPIMSTVENFLTLPVRNVDQTKNNVEIEGTRHLDHGGLYKNIFELRRVKLNYLMNQFSSRVKNVEIFSYEYFKENYEKVLEMLREKYKLRPKENYPVNISYHIVGGEIVKKKSKLKNPISEKSIIPYLDHQLEKQAGYIFS